MIGLVRAFALIGAVLLATPGDAREWKTLRIGSEGAYPPLNYLDANGRLQGFEIELGEALCKRMLVECEFVQQDWDDMIPALLAGKFDAIMASMSITEERKRYVDFSDRYSRSPGIFVARRSANLRETEPASMQGRVIGAQAKTTHARYLQEAYKPAGATIRLYSTQREGQLDLAAGRIDALFGSKFATVEWLRSTQEGACCAQVGSDVYDRKYMGEGAAVALRPNDDALREKFNRAIAAVLADGTYKAINEKYFPFSVY